MQRSDFLCRTDYEARSCVNDGLATGFTEAQLVTNIDPLQRNRLASLRFQNKQNGGESVSTSISARLIHSVSPVNLDLPVGLSRDVDVVQFSGVVLRVNPP